MIRIELLPLGSKSFKNFRSNSMQCLLWAHLFSVFCSSLCSADIQPMPRAQNRSLKVNNSTLEKTKYSNPKKCMYALKVQNSPKKVGSLCSLSTTQVCLSSFVLACVTPAASQNKITANTMISRCANINDTFRYVTILNISTMLFLINSTTCLCAFHCYY